ncbi:tRNA (adenosine(37)-N6)-threonylcarbamoyltransferase complex dimerization subunit type 1 TsaB [Oceanibium sediminis]|uniref:tRNA (adenosine(37)-N6)-threonylcarbamoyltransferase complex dimerization subunit type 1 TsaB n=1 Tax=Oceanibium sediminis TaxID=2026339 RepID=UPI00280C0DF0|nr:tRNA (adenosine(37)-N6)-threonylcarbamoyltransferase complex dimerization subunit type 1 TsaB [Oceanibium sediminis]
MAVFIDDTVVAEIDEPMTRGQADALLPLAEKALGTAGLSWRDLDRIAVGVGPGNFTGTRIAVSAVRGLALALDIPALGVTSFEALAEAEEGPTLVSIDARQGRIYLQGFGAAALPPRQVDLETPGALSLPPETRVIGHRAAQLANTLGLTAGPETAAAPIAAFARVAARMSAPFSPPAPLYLRAADAALPADPPPVILDDS